jgi:hypothetical protein
MDARRKIMRAFGTGVIGLEPPSFEADEDPGLSRGHDRDRRIKTMAIA